MVDDEFNVWLLDQDHVNDRLYERIDHLDAVTAELQWQVLDIRDNLLYLKPDLDRKLSLQIARAISLACDAYAIDPDLAVAMAYHESGFDPLIRGRDREYGLFQICPWWCSYYHLNCDERDLLDPAVRRLVQGGWMSAGTVTLTMHQRSFKAHVLIAPEHSELRVLVRCEEESCVHNVDCRCCASSIDILVRGEFDCATYTLPPDDEESDSGGQEKQPL
jgi:hypothetical protein